jgi:flagellar biosynthetic protein FliP
MTLLGLLPALVLMMTSFTRFVIVLSLLRRPWACSRACPTASSPAWR